MTTSIPCTVVLTCHPEISSRAVQGIEARVGWTPDRALALFYVLKGNMACLPIPLARSGRSADRLWQHTCFEAFLAVKGKPEYCEFNFAPSGEWAAYSFRSYRAGAPLAEEELVPKIAVRRADDSLELDAIVRLDRLPMIPPGVRLRLGLSAVIEEDNSMLSYWALKHPPGKPDFHHPEAFELELELPFVKDVNESAMGKR
jgi:hypothetical protein